MKRFVYLITAFLYLTVFGCNLPAVWKISPENQQATVQIMLQKTIAAASTGTQVAVNPPSGFTQTTLAVSSATQSQSVLATTVSAAQKEEATAMAVAAKETAVAAQNAAVASQNAAAAQQTAAAFASAQAQAANATAAAATLQAQAVVATSIAWSATSTALASSQLLNQEIRLSFAPGATSTNLEGQIFGGQAIDYLVRAMANQIMLVYVNSPADNVSLGVSGAQDMTIFLSPAAEVTSFNGVLPATQDYRLTLFSSAQNAPFNLQVIIPARIQFAPGAISASVSGNVQSGSVNHYLLRAMAGQTMNVTILSPGNDVFLTIYGLDDGNPLIRYQSGASNFTGVLLSTQDYMIEAVSVGPATGYTLNVIVS